MGEPVAAPFQLGVGDRFTALRHDDGWLVRSPPEVQTWIHRALPRSEAEDAPQDRSPLKSTEDMSTSTATVAVPKRQALPLTDHMTALYWQIARRASRTASAPDRRSRVRT